MNRNAWLGPLIIPVVVLALTAWSSLSKGTHIVHSTPASAVGGAVFLALLVGGPAFWSGWLYQRSHVSQELNREQRD